MAAKLFGRYNGRLSGWEWFPYAAFLLCQTVLLGSWFQIYVYGSGAQSFVWLICDIVLCVATDVALYFAMRGMAQQSALRAENALLEKQIDAQKEHYAALTEQYENVRRMRHDIASHVYTIKLLLDRGETDEAADYAAELLPHTKYRSSLGQCENPVVDAFLFSRMEELRAQGFELSAEVALPAYLKVSNSELIIAFGNLLDNAAEACRELEDRRIAVTAQLAKGYIVIKVVNPLPPAETAREKKRRIPELERGVGFNILTELAKKYDGRFVCREGEGRFTAELMLMEGKTDADSGL